MNRLRTIKGGRAKAPVLSPQRRELLECLGHIDNAIQGELEAKSIHEDHAMKLRELLKVHETLPTLEHFRKQLNRLAEDREGIERFEKMLGAFQRQLHLHPDDMEHAGQRAKQSLSPEEYEKVMNVVYAKKLLAHLESFDSQMLKAA